ncbi:MAG: hypothetical protein R3C49_02775 [Planctomycetaceae bacterium]
MLCGGTLIKHLELLRNDEALLNAVGADLDSDPRQPEISAQVRW